MGLKPGYKKTEAGVIPEDWDSPSIGEIASFSSGAGISVAELYPDDSAAAVPVYGGNGIAGYTTTALVPDATVVIGRVGQKCGEVYLTRSACWISDNALYARRFHRKINLDFFALALRGAGLNDFKNRNDLPLVTQSILHSTAVPVPSVLEEQERIAEAVRSAEELIGKLERLIAKKRDLKQAAMQQLLTGQTRLPGFTEKWKVKTLGDAIEKLVGGGTPARNNAAFWGGEIPWVTVKDFATFNPLQAQESITKQGLYSSATHLIPAGTLITSTRMALGKTVIYEVDVAINQDLKALFLKPDVNTRFLYYWFTLNEQKVDALGSGSTVKGISIADLKGLPFPFVSMPEQNEIVAVLTDIDNEIQALEQRLAKTCDLKQGMSQELLTGRTRLVSQEALKCLSAHALSDGPRTV